MGCPIISTVADSTARVSSHSLLAALVYYSPVVEVSSFKL